MASGPAASSAVGGMPASSRDRLVCHGTAPDPRPNATMPNERGDVVGSMPATTTDVALTRGGVSTAMPAGADQAVVRPSMVSGVSVDSNGSKFWRAGP